MEPIRLNPGPYPLLIIATMTALIQDLSTTGGAHAWRYHYSTDPMRSWSSARTWCQLHFTDMVAIQNQGEITYLNEMLPFNPTYYWIGIRKVVGVWTWVGTNRSLTPEAENWAVGEPNNAYEDCVEMYIRRDKDTTKWNDERCNKEKGTVCYTASCSEGSCGNHADCVETIGNFTCQCHPGFLSPPCEEAVPCDALSGPEHGRLQCYGSYGPSRFNSSCQFHCDLGYRLEGPERLQCQASGRWDHPAPRCQVERCTALNPTSDRLLMTCSHPIANSSFNSTCAFSCEEGFELSGQSLTKCDHEGKWTADVPTCSVIACAPISPPAMGNRTCVDSLARFSFGSSCSFTCLQGYTLAGSHTVACRASGQWSQPRPTCIAVQCSSLKVPPNAVLGCQGPIGPTSYGSTCTLHCEEGFNLIGSNTTQCSAQGRWSRRRPVCRAMQCRVLSAPPHGSLSCYGPHGAFSFSSRCALTCDEGFLPNGTAHTECSSLGTWSQDVPQCLAMQCRVLSAPPNGSLSCSGPHGAFSFSSGCALTCDEGFLPNGTAHTECSSLGLWSQEVPQCLAMQCRVLSAPPHGSLSCSGPHGVFSFSSRCALTCDEGFLPNGTAHTECSSLGLWSQEVPQCLAMQCRLLSAPPHGSLSCSGPHGVFSFSSRCALTCDEGFLPNGTAHTECSSLGTWSQEVPQCLAMQCRVLSVPPHGSLSCSGPHGAFSFSSGCALTCDEGFLPNGTAHTECSSLGTWSEEVPQCLAMQCRVLSTPPHGSLSCSGPHGAFSFSSGCALTCDEGFLPNGTAHTECSSLGTWSQEVPQCLAMQCRVLSVPPHGSLSCSGPHGAFSFSSGCALTCDEGFLPNGTAHTECSSLGTWSEEVPQCLAMQCRVLSTPPHGSLSCSGPHGAFSFSSGCALTCDEGFLPNGTAHTECSSLGTWSQEVPQCLAMQCRLLSAPPHGSLSCSGPHGAFSFSSRCALTCDEGFLPNGTAHTECSSLGTWSQEVPQCLAMQCRVLSAPPHGSLSCSGPHGAFSFSSGCALTCDEGFLPNGTAHTECSSLGLWSQEVPQCLARPCPLLVDAPHHGWMNCSHPHSSFSHGSHCDLGCSEGYRLIGTPSINCNASGDWSGEMPSCKVVQCEASWLAGLPASPLSASPLSLNCSHPRGNFSFGSRCWFSCAGGYSLNGTEELLCSSSGLWSSALPACDAEGMPMWSAILLYSGGAAASVVALLSAVGLGLLVAKRFQKKGFVNVNNSFWEERENPAFES